MKPLGWKAMYISPYSETGIEYKASYPTNLYQKVRLAVALKLMKWGYSLLLNNGTIKTETS